MAQVESEHWVYQSGSPELFERLQNHTFGGETRVELDGVVYSVTYGADSRGEFCVLQAHPEERDLGGRGA